MSPRTQRRIFGILGPAACFGIVLLAAPAPAEAASSDFKGWLLALDLALSEPVGLDNHIATVTNTNVLPTRTERIVLKNDPDTTWRGALGYDFGLDLGRVQVSYWSFANDDMQDFNKVGEVSPALFGYGFYGAMYQCNNSQGFCDSTLPVRFTGFTGVKAKTLDLDYTRSAEVGERFSLRWLAGLRTARYEEKQSYQGFDGAYTYLQSKNWDADARGIRVGAGGTFDFTQHFSLQAGLAYSALLGKTAGKSSQTFVNGGITCSFPPCTDTKVGGDHRLRGAILDLELKGIWSAGPVDISLGFMSSNWSGFVQDPVPASAFLLNPEGSSNDSLGFASFEVGLLWRVGGSRHVLSP